MAVGVGKLRPSLDPTRLAAQVLFGSKALRRRARALRVRVARLDGAHDGRERCHINRFTGQYLPVAEAGSMKSMGSQIGEDQKAFTY
jgi:hypothetical protein